ncbi:MAG: nucleotidyl transferase AbiEii/AbiGii toxin family protein [Nitrospirota bacterium]
MNDNPLIKSLKELCLFLEDQGIEYMLVGGLAVGIWGEPRATVDIDFLIAIGLDDFDILKHKLVKSSRFVFIHDKPMLFGKITFLRATIKSNTDISVDFLFADDEFKNRALQRKETVKVNDFSVNISSPEDLIILKLLSRREQDRLDAEKIIKIQKENLDMEYMKKWLQQLSIEFKKEWY